MAGRSQRQAIELLLGEGLCSWLLSQVDLSLQEKSEALRERTGVEVSKWTIRRWEQECSSSQP